MIDFQAITDLINLNLNGDPKIEPDKHREVEFALLDAIKQLSQTSINVLKQGLVTIGNVDTTDKRVVITFPDLGTNSYYVLGSIQSASSNWNRDNDVFWSWGEPLRTSFALYLREITNDTQNINFWYMIIPKTF